MVITETGFYDVVLNKNLDEEGNEIITITAHAHKPEPVLKEDQTPTGYYYCKYCRKYFADEIGTIQIDEEDVEYKVASIKEISSRDILPVIKYFENNMLVIEKNGVKYDILGRRLKQ